MHETPEDLRALQDLLDRSHASAGPHLRSIFTAERRLTAGQVAELMTGVQVLSLATVSAGCEPVAAPVDGLFYRARFHFGSSLDSIRFRHLRARPAVSATHTRGEQLAMVVHGTASVLDLDSDDEAGFRAYLSEVYPDWGSWGAGSPYARIEPRAMFAARFI